MISQYKEPEPPLFMENARFTKTSYGLDTCDLDDATINRIQRIFLNINDIDPINIKEEDNEIFSNLSQIIKSEKFIHFLPAIVPNLVYPQLVKILSETDNENIHKLFSKIITILTEDFTEQLTKDLTENLLDTIFINMTEFQYQYSTHYLFEIISILLNSTNENISLLAHEKFSVEYLFKFFQYIKKMLKENLEKDSDANSKLDKLSKKIANKWMRCVYSTIKKYPNDVSEFDATVILIEIKKYFDVVFKDPLLCKFLCYSISILIESEKISFTDFYQYGYPEFLSDLSHYDDDDEVKTYAFSVIGKLISINCYPIECNCSEFLNVILDSNENKDLVKAALYACRCFFDNHISMKETFETITSNMQSLFDFYNETVFSIKHECSKLFAIYLNQASSFDKNNFLELESVVFTIANNLINYIQLLDDFENIHLLINALLSFNKSLIEFDLLNLKSLDTYLSDFNECIEHLEEIGDENLEELITLMKESLNLEIEEE